MLRYLLDTNVISHPMSRVPSVTVMRRLDAIFDQCAIAAPVWHELQFGCKRMASGKRREALEDYLSDVVQTFHILPYDELAAQLHATERERLERTGTTVPFVDGQIAAIAQVNEMILVTANVRDFAPFRSLTVQNWEAG